MPCQSRSLNLYSHYLFPHHLLTEEHLAESYQPNSNHENHETSKWQSDRSWRMGARWQLSGDRSVSLEGTRREAANDDGPEHGLMLRGALRW
ncbi:MAG: hypothetical protein TH68_07530 [Candidatus Synechococcus spongiarum 142]|uniref:Uncharacterized protein n=1 Tax=Candidatus Synechococcus spongiarum 142 TaxID=1608213 RepID=A0A6N3X7G2_9SYNE|nr:MAG: hypothetical protein TH68_07530 [Candidatus Synechococcus spongiarum 142]